MNRTSEAKIQKEIRKRAFQRLDRLRQEQQNMQCINHTLSALQEVTGLPLSELEAIADDVRLFDDDPDDKFFSIKRQFLLVLGIFGLVIFFVWLLINH